MARADEGHRESAGDREASRLSWRGGRVLFGVSGCFKFLFFEFNAFF